LFYSSITLLICILKPFIEKKHLVNAEIKYEEVFLIEEGQSAVMSREEALQRAYAAGLDLVVVDVSRKPPVAKIMDYGKQLYRDSKKVGKGKRTVVKGVRLSLNTEQNDWELKLEQAKRFLKERNLVKVQLILKGREVMYVPRAMEKIKSFAQLLEEMAEMKEQPRRAGYAITMVLQPLS